MQVIFYQSSCSKERGLKEPVECDKSTSGYRTAATAEGLNTSDCGTVIEKPGQLGADGVRLSGKGKSIFSRGL